MVNDFGFARQCPDQTATVRCWVFLRGPAADVGLMDEGSGFIHAADQHFDVGIDHPFVVIIVTQFKGVIKEDVSLNLVIIRIDNLIEKFNKSIK